MAHDHGGHPHPGPQINHLNRAFLVGIVLNIGFVAVEFIAGLWLDSMALISDAGHNLSDVISLVLALIAFKLAKIKPSGRFTYGYKKSTVLVSFVNACLLLVAVGMILISSIGKLSSPDPIDGGMVAWVAGIGILINGFTAWLFLRDKEKDLNVKGAYLHMVADALVSVGVLVSGLIIRFTGWYVIDPVIGIMIAIVIFVSTWRLLTDSIRLSLDGVPVGVDVNKIKQVILNSDPAVLDVHHIHIWPLSTTENALTAHLVCKSQTNFLILKNKIKQLLVLYHITHATLEFEYPDEKCVNYNQ